MTNRLPISAQLAWWGTCWLRGLVAPDDLVEALQVERWPHLVSGLEPDGGTTSLLFGLAALRSRGVTGLGAAFPTEGDPVGLGGPSEFNHRALEVGEAVIATEAGLGLTPTDVGAGWVWRAGPAARRQLVDVGEADRGLRAALIEAAGSLADLDVARWRPEVADSLMNLRHGPVLVAPHGIPPRCVALAARAWQAMEICDLALDDDGGAVTAAEASARRDALVPLDRAGRRALTAACSPEVWPEE